VAYSSESRTNIVASGTIAYNTRFIDLFHTGAPAWDYLYEEPNYENGLYLRWEPARPYVKYALIQGAANLLDNGDTIPTMYLDVSWSGITRQLTLILNNGDFPVLETWITNFESVTENGLRLFLNKLSDWLGTHMIIFDPCFEYNFPSYMAGWGDRGDGNSFKIQFSIYNEKMHLIRRILDEDNLKNIYLASHANLLLSVENSGRWVDNPGFDGIAEYFDGMRQADVLGFSHYVDNLTVSWERARAIYEAISVSRPFIFFEYSPTSPWTTHLNVTAQFVDDSYAILPTYSFVKGIIWYFGPYFTQETILAIKQNAEIYENHI
jgi:hypothetical protein